MIFCPSTAAKSTTKTKDSKKHHQDKLKKHHQDRAKKHPDIIKPVGVGGWFVKKI
jgi:hypothetical protein